ncbi:MAG: alpha/beta hydrolase [Ruminococcaceae bacterium]|nr:alpha/beta hydrolase [Oscillospiraceae bacterium]
MTKSAETMKKRLEKLKTVVNGCSLSATRAGQQALGLFATLPHRREETFETISFPTFTLGKLTPQAIADPTAAVMYIHGGGFVGGGLSYARGFATTLAAELSLTAYCPSYRLAPEHPFPAALKDVLAAYRYVTTTGGIRPDRLVLVGESAGGGLLYSLCLQLKRMGKPMPAGLIAISPWVDLTLSGPSYEANREVDPSLTVERLRFFADCYTDTPDDPFVSPLFGDLSGMPPSLIVSGGVEIMLSDAASLHAKLTEAGCRSEHHIAPDLWHAYPLYAIEESHDDFDRFRGFVKECIAE